ncbi:hypothetical protein QNI16_36775 [Cytophagaceae bacterium YF14B1]|uniref:Uncharacterized protein n=1 Tax=Xanthocytophaga flava TaxID=3048013 RepID=A0AAE3QYZ4_9BACT|nr:hypothetical protein [Xanthocytophaga flavus]MDJ1486095.1 hypothetical protein [Xanthocytophaga flavus]
MSELSKSDLMFIESIKEREKLWEEVQELVEFLGYDLNPIGGNSSLMVSLMREEALKTITDIRTKLDEIELSIKKNSV